MRIEGRQTLVVKRFFEMITMSDGFKCACCKTVFVSLKMGAYVKDYEPRDPIMKKAVPPLNAAAYAMCKQCADLPEKESFPKIQATLIDSGVLQTGHKPIDETGSHRAKRAPIFDQDTKVNFENGK